VVVVVHQAEGEDLPAIARHGRCEDVEEGNAVEVVTVDRAAVDTTRRDVVDPVGQLGTPNARHPLKL
jgi:hypothetical protein